MQTSEQVQYALNGASILTAIGTIAGYLPNVAALFSIIWLGMQMVIHWDTFVAKIVEKVRRLLG